MTPVLTRLRHSRPVGVARYHFYRDVALAWPKRRSCNTCGWRGRRFLTYLHRFVLCPQCGSHVRHRLIAAVFQYLDYLDLKRIAHGRVLHISPEYCLGLILKPLAGRYVSVDWTPGDCTLRQDITAMAFGEGVFDVVVSCDTLEHIRNDVGALAECRRVLRPGGVAILTVPQSDDVHATFEDPMVQTDADRVRAYGQFDHVRNYGLDFGDRVAAVGFRVRCVDAGSFDSTLVTRHVLAPPIALDSPLGWNHRRIYLAERI